MSNTRHAKPGGPLRQERFASSSEFQLGLLANLVAKRCQALEVASDRELIWFLQNRSWQPGGLAGFVRELLETFPDTFATVGLKVLGAKRILKPSDVRVLRAEFSALTDDDRKQRGSPWEPPDYPLRGEDRPCSDSLEERAEFCLTACRRMSDEERDCEAEKEKRERESHPRYYPAADFKERCRSKALVHLEEFLSELCLNPDASLNTGPLYLPELRKLLRGAMNRAVEAERSSSIATAIGRRLYDGMDFALATGSMVLIDGQARTGKTFAAKSWCRQHPGSARYVQVPSSADEIGFYRAIARALGVSINLKSKAQELRQRVEQAIEGGGILVCFDEAHYCWPQSNYRDALPQRINWIMTALVNQGVPVALITTPQFLRQQRRIEEKTCWTSEQFTGRIGRYIRLPDTLSREDLAAVAHSVLPEADKATLGALASYADVSSKHLAAIEATVKAARWTANKAGRATVTAADVRQAIRETLPSDTALAEAMKASGRRPGKRQRVDPLQDGGSAPAAPLHTPSVRRSLQPISASLRDRRESVSGLVVTAKD